MLKKSSFVLGIQILSQLIMMLTYMNLTTNYDNAVVERFYHVTTISIYLSGFIGLKLDVAHLQPKIGSWRGDMLLALSLMASVVMSSLIAFWSLAIALLSFVTFINNSLALSNIRESNYMRFGLAKLVQVLLFAFLINAQLISPVGSFILSNLVSSLILLNINFRVFKFIKRRSIFVLIYSYKDYLKYSIFSAIFLNFYLNIFGIFVPQYGDSALSVEVFKIEKFFIAPLLLISNSVSSVFRSEAQLYVHKLESIDILKSNLLKTLLILGGLYFLVCFSGLLGFVYDKFGLSVPDNTIVFVFMIIFGFLRFFMMPWMSLYYIYNRLKNDFRISFALFIVSLLSLLVAGLFSFEYALVAFVIMVLLVYSYVFKSLFYEYRYS